MQLFQASGCALDAHVGRVETTRVETLLASTLFLMSHCQRGNCPHLADCVARHLECIARHPDTDPAIRQVCLSMQSAWNSKHDGAPAWIPLS